MIWWIAGLILWILAIAMTWAMVASGDNNAEDDVWDLEP
jgi:hypothetical protein